jgi:hypothetical protein
MIYVAEIPKENEYCSFDRNLHDFSTEVWSAATQEDFMQAASVRVTGRYDAFVTFEDAVNAMNIGDGIQQIMIFMNNEEISNALNDRNLWGSGVAAEKDAYSHPTTDELLSQAKYLMAAELHRNLHPVEPIFIDEDGASYFG